MKKIITKIFCDVCGKENENEDIDIQVIFTTEQNEGRSCNPYLCKETLNLCDSCMNNILYKGKYIFADGAMGCNTYKFEPLIKDLGGDINE